MSMRTAVKSLLSRDDENKARAYQEAHAHKIHRAIQEPIPWDDTTRQYKAGGIGPLATNRSTSADLATDDFKSAIAAFTAAANKDRSLRELDIRDAAKWDDVIGEAKSADQKNRDMVKGWRGAPISFVRDIAKWASGVDPWLELLGGNEYSAFVCAGLRIIIKAAVFESEKREKISSAMESLPGTIQKAQDQRVTFAKDDKLRTLALALYVEILGATEAMIEWLAGGDRWKKIVNDLVRRRNRKERKIDDQLIEVEKSIRAMKERVETLLQRTIVDIDDRTRDMRTEQVGMILTMNQLQHMSVDRDAADKLRDLEMERLRRAVEAATQAQNSLLTVLNGTIEEANWYKLQRSFEPAIHSTITLTVHQLLEILDTNVDKPQHDVYMALSQRIEFADRTQEHAMSLLQSQPYRQWMFSAESGLLLVNGDAMNDAADTISPLSVLCGFILQSLGDMGRSRTIHHFCGLHVSTRDHLYGPSGLLLSLAGQLLMLDDVAFDLRFADDRGYCTNVRQGDLPTLCHLLYHLFVQLPMFYVVFCVIDGISVFETSKLQADLASALDCLSRLVEDSQLRGTVKVLITHPGISYVAQEILPRQQQYTLPSGGEDGDGSLLSLDDVNRASTLAYSAQQRPHDGMVYDTYDLLEDESYDFDEGNV